MNNQSALDRLKEIEAEKKEIEAQIKDGLSSIKFPVYLKERELIVKVSSLTQALYITSDKSTITSCSIGEVFLTSVHEPITEQEFESARTEAINKLSNL